MLRSKVLPKLLEDARDFLRRETKIQTLKLRCLLPPKPQKIGIAQEISIQRHGRG